MEGNTKNSRPEVVLGKGVLKICSKFTGEHPCQSAIWHGCSPINLLHIFRSPFPKNTSRRLFCFNLLLVGFEFAVFLFCFFRVLFNISAIMKLRIASYLYIFCFVFILASHGIIMLKIVFSVPKETKFEVDTTSIILSYLYHFRNVNNELFKYC